MRSDAGTIQKIENGRYRVRVTYGYDSKTLKRVRKSKVVRGTYAEAKAVRNQMLVEAGKAEVLQADVTVAEAFDLFYTKSKEKGLRDTTLALYESVAKNHIKPGLGHIKLSKLNALIIETWLTKIKGEGSKYSAYTLLRTMLRWAYKKDFIDQVPTDKVDDPPQRVQKAKAVIAAEDFWEYIDLFQGSSIEAAIICAFATGMRRSEIAAMDWERLDLSVKGEGWHGKYYVDRACHYIQGKGIVVRPPKTESGYRTVTFPEWAGQMLYDLRGTGDVTRIGHMLVQNGHRMDPRKISVIWKKTLDTYNKGKQGEELPYIQLKNIRHSHATILAYDLEVSQYELKQRMGHASIATTSSYYIQQNESADVRAAAGFSRITGQKNVSQNVPKSPEEAR